MFISKELRKKIKIGYTLGDLGGVGPEIFAKFKAKNSNNPNFEIILVDEILLGKEGLEQKIKNIKTGKPSKEAGLHAFKTLELANKLALDKKIDYLVTGPVAKESLALANYDFSGQTEVLAHINNLSREDIEMFFLLDNFRVVLATRHIPLKDISTELSRRFEKVLYNSFEALEKIFGTHDAKIAVAGLNPHAGENGLIGNEEIEFMRPIISKLNQANSKKKVEGPFPADTMFAKVAHNYLANDKPPYDLYVAAYHDQALPMIKGLAGFRAINLTTGLPYIRVSVDHGTAYDIAGKNIADADGLTACTQFLVLRQTSQCKQESASISP